MRYCEAYAALLDMYVDGELASEEMTRVRAHLETCPGCQAYVDDALAIRAGFPEAEDTVVPEGFAGEVMERIRRASGKDAKITELKRRSARRWTGTLAALAACCALVIFVRTGFNSINGGERVAMTAASGGASAPAGYDMDGNEAAEIAPQMADEELPGEPEVRAAENQAELRSAARAENGPAEAAGMDWDNEEHGNAQLAAAPTEGALDVTAPVAQADAAPAEGIDKSRGAALYLTAGEAGDMLNNFTLVREEAGERWYKLTCEEYQTLLEALGRQDETPETAEDGFLVVVTTPGSPE